MVILAHQYEWYIESDHIAEMQWIALGSGVPYRDILLINLFDDLKNTAWCSSIADTRWETMIHARNLDYNISFLAGRSVIFHYIDGGYITVWFPWYIWAITATNAAWLSLSNHTSTSPSSSIWTPTWLLYKSVIENAENISEAEEILTQAQRTIGNNVMISSLSEKSMVVFELNDEVIQKRKWEKLFSTNHYIDDAFEDNVIPNSQRRYDYLEKKDIVTINDAIQTMQYYDWAASWRSSVSNHWTVLGVIFIPEYRHLYVARWDTAPVTQAWYAFYEYER